MDTLTTITVIELILDTGTVLHDDILTSRTGRATSDSKRTNQPTAANR
ncbi:hypothetical protein [Arsenophonus sp.]